MRGAATLPLAARSCSRLPASARAEHGVRRPGEREVRSLDFRGNDVLPRAATSRSASSTTPSSFAATAASRVRHASLPRQRRAATRRRPPAGVLPAARLLRAAVDTTVTPIRRRRRARHLPHRRGTAGASSTRCASSGLDTSRCRSHRRHELACRCRSGSDSTYTRCRRRSTRSSRGCATTAIRAPTWRRATRCTTRRASRDASGSTCSPGHRARIGEMRVINEPLPEHDAQARRRIPSSVRLLACERATCTASTTSPTRSARSTRPTCSRHVEVGLAPDSAPAAGRLARDGGRAAARELPAAGRHGGRLGGARLLQGAHAATWTRTSSARRDDSSSPAQVSKIGYGDPTRIADGKLCAPAIRDDPFSERAELLHLSDVSGCRRCSGCRDVAEPLGVQRAARASTRRTCARRSSAARRR